MQGEGGKVGRVADVESALLALLLTSKMRDRHLDGIHDLG